MMGIPLVSGREFTRADDEKTAPVAIVNETMAAKYRRGRNPLGERVQVKGRWMQVVAVAKDSKYESIRETPRPFFYVPLRQNFARGLGLKIRTRLSPEAMAKALAREVHALDPDHGVMSYAVSESRRELGLRMALGARHPISYGL